MGIREELLARSAQSYGHMFRDRVAATPDRLAFLVPDTQSGSDTWTPLTWAQAQDTVDILSAGLLSLGLQPEERVGIASTTRIEWVLADLAIACSAGATTTVYPNTAVEDMHYILRDAHCVIMFLENAEQLSKVTGQHAVGEQLRHVILFDDDRAAGDRDDLVHTWDDLLERGRQQLAAQPSCVDEAMAGLTPQSLSTLIYTSGTTGRPKGVELLHQSWTFEGASIQEVGLVNEDDLLYLWLPLSHVFGRDLLSCQIQVGFASAVDGRIDRIVQGMQETKPTVLVGVPRIFEKVRAAVMTKYPRSGLRGRISKWAFAVGRESRPYRLKGEPLPRGLRARYALAHRLVFSKLHDAMGGNIRFLVSGSAKLSRQVQQWFYSAGFTLIEGYGLTETAAIAFLNLPSEPRFGTVGPPIPGVEAKLTEIGEVIIRGPNVARGYHNLPDKTEAVFTEDGWFYTGDIGSMDEDGFLTITDRKRDIIKTSGGKFVAPQKVENAIVANIPYVSQAVAIGEGHKFITALLVLDPGTLQQWADRRNHDDKTYAELSQMPEVRKSIDRFMRRTNSHLEQWETVKRYTILDHEMGVDDGAMTPSMKVRRSIVLERYRDEIDALYEDAGEVSDDDHEDD